MQHEYKHAIKRWDALEKNYIEVEEKIKVAENDAKISVWDDWGSWRRPWTE